MAAVHLQGLSKDTKIGIGGSSKHNQKSILIFLTFPNDFRVKVIQKCQRILCGDPGRPDDSMSWSPIWDWMLLRDPQTETQGLDHVVVAS